MDTETYFNLALQTAGNNVSQGTTRQSRYIKIRNTNKHMVFIYLVHLVYIYIISFQIHRKVHDISSERFEPRNFISNKMQLAGIYHLYLVWDWVTLVNFVP